MFSMTSRPPQDSSPGADLAGDLPAEATEEEIDEEFEEAPDDRAGLDVAPEAATPGALQRGIAVIRATVPVLTSVNLHTVARKVPAHALEPVAASRILCILEIRER